MNLEPNAPQKAVAYRRCQTDTRFDRQRSRGFVSIELAELCDVDPVQAIAKVANHGLITATGDNHGRVVVV
jgi:hypothetical protein